jgi:hypothetical protein
LDAFAWKYQSHLLYLKLHHSLLKKENCPDIKGYIYIYGILQFGLDFLSMGRGKLGSMLLSDDNLHCSHEDV